MNQKLESLIEQEAQLKRVEEADKETGRLNAIEQVRAAMREAIGDDLYQQFKEQGLTENVSTSPNRYNDGNRWSAKIIWKVNGSDEHRLCPFTLRGRTNDYQKDAWVYASLWHYQNSFRRDEKSIPEKLGAFLLEARTNWTTWRKDRAKEDLKKITRSGRWKTDDETLPALEALKAKYPEFEEDVNETIAECHRERESVQAHQAQMKKAAQVEIERRQREMELFDAEVQRFVEFQKEFNKVMERNIERRKAIQMAFDEPILIYKLTFGYCAQGDEGETYADTDHIYVLDAANDVEGYWTRHDGQKVKIWNPVSLETMVVKASDGFTLRRNVWIEQAVDGEDNHLRAISYFPWAHSIEKIRVMIAEAGFESLPNFEWAEELPRYSWDDALRKAWDICPSLSDTED